MNPTKKADGEDDDIVLAQIEKSIAESEPKYNHLAITNKDAKIAMYNIYMIYCNAPSNHHPSTPCEGGKRNSRIPHGGHYVW
jgi:hypothetical protein